MYSKNHRPTADQKRFQSWIRETFKECQNCGAPAEHLHHILGSSAKHNKQWIGQWAVVMLCAHCNLYAILPPKREQLDRFVTDILVEFGKPEGMTDEQLEAIQTWKR